MRAVREPVDRCARAFGSRRRAFALDVLLARYAELDPSEAVAAAKELDVPAASLASLYHAWVTSSPAAALASLGALEDPKKTEVATGLLALVSDDDALVARVIAVLPAQSRALYASALGELARTSPAEALARAGKIARRRAAQGCRESRAVYVGRSDPRAVVDYLAGLVRKASATRLGAECGSRSRWLRQSSRSIGPRRSPKSFEGDSGVAIQTLAQRDPKAALARFADLPRGCRRPRRHAADDRAQLRDA